MTCASVRYEVIHHAELTLQKKADPNHQRCLPHFQPVTSQRINYSAKQLLRQPESKSRECQSNLISILSCWGWASRDHRKFSKSYILSEALNASVGVSRSLPLSLSLCVITALEQDLGLSLTYTHKHTYTYTHRYTAVSHNTQALGEMWCLQPYPLVYMTTTKCTTHRDTYTLNLTLRCTA